MLRIEWTDEECYDEADDIENAEGGSVGS